MTDLADPRLESLELRRVDNIGKQIDNATLPAGASMTYYCHSCGTQTAVLPEDWWETAPPKYCGECEPLLKDMLVEYDSYDAWLQARGEKPVPR